ncbi:MAG TPA: TauD/TfdA family dioxygenase [Alphaproteobacteria bacterium]|nr:TauD/TfdA family dioxygenase [Alphaproteobacteria bacterium]
MRNATLDIRPVNRSVGAEIYGVDLAEPLDEGTCGEIRNALLEHGVIFFRDQNLTPDQHLAFGGRMGTVDVDPTGGMGHPEGYPLITEVRKEPEQTENTGGNWHTDHSFDAAPPLGSILLARELPESGGDTLFAGMHAAYNALSDGLKKTLEGLKAVHAKTHAFDNSNRSADRKVSDQKRAEIHQKFATREAVHPVVLRHPESGRKILYVNPNYTVRFDGWTEDESKPLLKFLYAHASNPEFTCRFRWREGSIAFWDNRAVWHRAVNDYNGYRRLMHRVTLAGTPLT